LGPAKGERRPVPERACNQGKVSESFAFSSAETTRKIQEVIRHWLMSEDSSVEKPIVSAV
jgi:hypothetical protein